MKSLNIIVIPFCALLFGIGAGAGSVYMYTQHAEKLAKAESAARTKELGKPKPFTKAEREYLNSVIAPIDAKSRNWSAKRSAFFRKTQSAFLVKQRELEQYCTKLKEEIKQCKDQLGSVTVPVRFLAFAQYAEYYLTEQLSSVEAYEYALSSQDLNTMLKIINDMTESTNSFNSKNWQLL